MARAMRLIGMELGLVSGSDGLWWAQQAQEEVAVAQFWGVVLFGSSEFNRITPSVSLRRATEVAVRAPSVR